jgi:tetratricopeptide (TPR) repeat protein
MTLSPLQDVFELLDDGRHAEALRVVDRELKRRSHDADLHALRALVLLKLERRDEAAEDVAVALRLASDNPFTQFTAGEVALARGEVLEAIAAAQRAQRLIPDDADFILLEARARTRAGQWERVLTLTERVLAKDPDNELASLLGAIARETRSPGPLNATAWQQLADRFPLNSLARAGRAWTLLETGRAKQARGEFEQALALDPSLEWAKEGLVLALKARNPIYAALLRYFLWMGRLPQRTQWFLMIGGLLGYNFLRRTAEAQPALKPIIVPVLVLYGAFLFLSWLADPLLNMLLLLRADGRRLLRPDEKHGALIVGACLGVALLLGLASSITEWRGAFLGALGVAFTSLTFAGAYQTPAGPGRRALLGLAAILFSIALLSSVVPSSLAASLIVIVFLGVAGGLWASRVLSTRAVKVRRSAT